MKHLRRNISTLRTLQTAKPAVVKSLIKNGNKELISILCESCHNILKGNIPLSKHQKCKLGRYKNILRQLGNKRKCSLKHKKTLLLKGGFLNVLLKPVLGILGGLLNG